MIIMMISYDHQHHHHHDDDDSRLAIVHSVTVPLIFSLVRVEMSPKLFIN